MEQLKVAVLMGGVSAEREVSLRSGEAVCGALTKAGHDVHPVDVTDVYLEEVRNLSPDVAFIALHGRFGEDGGAQAKLESWGIPYTGSDAQTSRVGMDKMASKCFFITHDVPTPSFRLMGVDHSWTRLREAVNDLSFPLVIKPVDQGSSVGVSVARDHDDVLTGLKEAFRYGDRVILERYVRGRELTVSILEQKALPIVEVSPHRTFFDYKAKYQDEKTRYITQPDLNEHKRIEVQQHALAAHIALGCTGFSRVDMILEEDGCCHVLEVNTIPGLTERSLFPMAAKSAGIDFPRLCDRLIRLGLPEARRRERDLLEAALRARRVRDTAA